MRMQSVVFEQSDGVVIFMRTQEKTESGNPVVRVISGVGSGNPFTPLFD